MPPLASLTYWTESLDIYMEVVTLTEPVAEVIRKESFGLLLAGKNHLAVPGHPDPF